MIWQVILIIIIDEVVAIKVIDLKSLKDEIAHKMLES
jgi:hypothetical protein